MGVYKLELVVDTVFERVGERMTKMTKCGRNIRRARCN